MQIVSPQKEPLMGGSSWTKRRHSAAVIPRAAVSAGGVIFYKMFGVCVLLTCLLSLPGGEARASTRRYKPVIQVTEEIDINDITFTTSAPDYSGVAKGGYSRPLETSPSPDRYGAPARYRPYKVIKVQDGFLFKPRLHEKSKLPFEQSTAYSAAEHPKYSAKIVPFPSQLPSKAPAKASSLLNQDKNFIPSPTFSPTVLAQINSESTRKFSEPFATQRATDRPNSAKKPIHIRKKIPENHHSGAGVPEELSAAPEVSPPPHFAPYSDAPQQSESLLSEVSAVHKGGSSADNLDDVAGSLDLKTGERVEFQMYGMDGPKSYKFGFDTGKGHNRHFRFEERDSTGKVKGHYGYLDEEGKMRIMKYEADPITGFHAGPVEISPDDN